MFFSVGEIKGFNTKCSVDSVLNLVFTLLVSISIAHVVLNEIARAVESGVFNVTTSY